MLTVVDAAKRLKYGHSFVEFVPVLTQQFLPTYTHTHTHTHTHTLTHMHGADKTNAVYMVVHGYQNHDISM